MAMSMNPRWIALAERVLISWPSLAIQVGFIIWYAISLVFLYRQRERFTEGLVPYPLIQFPEDGFGFVAYPPEWSMFFFITSGCYWSFWVVFLTIYLCFCVRRRRQLDARVPPVKDPVSAQASHRWIRRAQGLASSWWSLGFQIVVIIHTMYDLTLLFLNRVLFAKGLLPAYHQVSPDEGGIFVGTDHAMTACFIMACWCGLKLALIPHTLFLCWGLRRRLRRETTASVG